MVALVTSATDGREIDYRADLLDENGVVHPAESLPMLQSIRWQIEVAAQMQVFLADRFGQVGPLMLAV